MEICLDTNLWFQEEKVKAKGKKITAVEVFKIHTALNEKWKLDSTNRNFKILCQNCDVKQLYINSI